MIINSGTAVQMLKKSDDLLNSKRTDENSVCQRKRVPAFKVGGVEGYKDRN